MNVSQLSYSKLLLHKLDASSKSKVDDSSQAAQNQQQPAVIVCFCGDPSAAETSKYDRTGKATLQASITDNAPADISTATDQRPVISMKRLVNYAQNHPVVMKVLNAYQQWHNQNLDDSTAPSMETFQKFLNNNDAIHKRSQIHMGFFKHLFRAVEAEQISLDKFNAVTDIWPRLSRIQTVN